MVLYVVYISKQVVFSRPDFSEPMMLWSPEVEVATTSPCTATSPVGCIRLGTGHIMVIGFFKIGVVIPLIKSRTLPETNIAPENRSRGGRWPRCCDVVVFISSRHSIVFHMLVGWRKTRAGFLFQLFSSFWLFLPADLASFRSSHQPASGIATCNCTHWSANECLSFPCFLFTTLAEMKSSTSSMCA